MDSVAVLILDVLEVLKNLPRTQKTAFVGLDGYIDKIQHPVQYQKEDGNVYFSTLSDFGQKISAASRQSAQVELFTQETKLGGNAPIMANALAQLGIANTCMGTLGYPDIHPIFQDIDNSCELVSVGEAAQTNALEFNDGKLILSELSTFNMLDWESVKKKINLEHIRKKTRDATLFALVDWSNLPFATSIWQGILDDIVRYQDLTERNFLFDLTDPSKKGRDEIHAVLDLMKQYKDHGQVTMGLNENEAHKLYTLLKGNGMENDLYAKGQYIFDMIKIDRLVIHPIDCCLVFETGKTSSIQGRLIKHPRVTTGGGDNFNAGFAFGMLNAFSTQHCMILAMATSGSYVEFGQSPKINDLIDFLSIWLQEV
ncbi:MAG: hypothetical protein CL868_18245 [Cytophagaceae bacterium]|nr:hypothetical protein [Cytophagaceae bacterium]|tara:strand:+ start:1090 stop:2199 length:1110 start_codon:yes stop_codon:yes gene_type:complete